MIKNYNKKKNSDKFSKRILQYSIPFSNKTRLYWNPVAILSIFPRSVEIGSFVNFNILLLWPIPNYPLALLKLSWNKKNIIKFGKKKKLKINRSW